MNYKTISAFLVLVVLALLVFREEVQVPVEVPVFLEQPRVERTPEFRPPPYKTYKPPNYQQIGILTGQDGETLPLYGKHSSIYNDRWNYYSTSLGEQVFSLPVSSQQRDCTEDIGCHEIYDGDQVDVFGSGAYTAKIYRNAPIQKII